MKEENKVTFTPIGDRVIIKTEKQQTQTSGGVFLPDISKEEGAIKGTIIAKGPGNVVFGHAENRSAMQCKVGDDVLIPKFGAHIFEYEGEEYRIIREQEILTILGKNNEE